MGAFGQLQSEFGFFDLNVRVPSLTEYSAFSNIIEMSRLSDQTPPQNDAPPPLRPADPSHSGRYFFETDSVLSQLDASEHELQVYPLQTLK